MSLERPHTLATSEQAKTPNDEIQPGPRRWHSWSWLLIPLLAVVAYATVLRLGFISDDLVLLYQARQTGIDTGIFIPQAHWFLYRPLGTFLVWQLGWSLWGYNPFPFHFLSLFFHASTSLLFGLWAALVFKSRPQGWLAGALFATFPLHFEAVGWIAAQWDVLAVLFGMLSLFCWTLWWSNRFRGWTIYTLSVVCYCLAIFTKESMLTFLPLFVLSAWLITPTITRKRLTDLGLAVIPFATILAFNLGLRLAYWGHLGGYGRTRLDYLSILPASWDRMISYGRLLVAPLNASIWGQTVTQIVALLLSLGLVIALIRFGRDSWRALLTAGVWLVFALLPVLILPVGINDLQNNRFLYLAAAGYCFGVAALVYSAVNAAIRHRVIAYSLVAALIASCVITTWIQLGPWHVASAQVADVNGVVQKLVSLRSSSDQATWYVENTPDNYKGAYILRLGLGVSGYFATGLTRPAVLNVNSINDAPLASESQNDFALRFLYSDRLSRFLVDEGRGITGVSAAPDLSPVDDSESLSWDFKQCDPAEVGDWQSVGANLRCLPGKGLVVTPSQSDAQLHTSGKARQLAAAIGDDGAAYIRFLVAMAGAGAGGTPTRPTLQWFWRDNDSTWTEANSRAVPLRLDNNSHIYWEILPAADLGKRLAGLRLDPSNLPIASTISWIKIDVIK